MTACWRTDGTRWILVLAATLLWPTLAEAHRLRLRVRTNLTLTAATATQLGEVVIGGRLLDARGRGVAGRPVAVSIRWLGLPQGPSELALAATPGTAPGGTGDTSREVVTGSTGGFRATWPRTELPMRRGRLAVRASFLGNDALAGSDEETVFDLDQARGEVRLEVEPLRLSTDLDAAKVAVFAGVEGQPLAGRPVTLRIDGHPVAVLRSGADGWIETQLSLKRLLPTGTRNLSAEMEGTRDIRGARAQVALQVAVAVEVALAVRQDDCPQARICLQGRVLVHRGEGRLEPPKQAALMIDAQQVRLGHVPVRADGRFAVSLNSEALSERFGPGPLAVVALADVPQAFHLTGLSDVVAIDVPPPPALSHWLYLALIMVLAVGLAWRRWQDRRRERSLAEELAAVAAGLPVQAVRRVGTGGLDVHLLRGTVIHGENGRPVAARVGAFPLPEELDQMGEEGILLDCHDGRFRFGPLTPGDWLLRVECEEHEPLEIPLLVPHDGTFDGCELLPRSCRALVRSALGRAVHRRTGTAVDWWRETPRGLEPRWRAALRRGHREVRVAVSAADSALYGRKTEMVELGQVRANIERVDEV